MAEPVLMQMSVDPIWMAEELFGVLSDKQKEMILAEEDEIFLGGGAGSGKTRGALIAWAVRAIEFGMRGFPYNALVLRATFPQLREIITLAQEMFVPIGGVYKESSKTLTLPQGSTLELGYLESDAERFQYQGRSWGFVLWDEVQRRATPTSPDWLYSRLRAPTKEINGVNYMLPLRTVSTANPRGPGNNWLRKRFIEPAPAGGGVFTREVETVDTEGRAVLAKRSVRYQHSTVMDNPWLRHTPYVQNLMLLPEAERKALLEGDFFAIEGAFFSEFNRRVHVTKHFKPPEDAPIILGGDWGTASPSHFVWCCELSDGRFYVFAEFTTRDTDDWTKGTWAGVTDVAEALNRIEARNQWDTSERWLDSACWSDMGTETSVGEMFNALGLFFQKAVKKKNLKARNLRELMKVVNGRSRLVISEQCRYLIQEIETLQTDEQDPSKWDERGSDHGVDALQYATSRNIVALGGDQMSKMKRESVMANRAKIAAMQRRRA